MSDDLSKLTPGDPSSVDPGWNDKRESILDDVLADASHRRRSIGRWVAGAAAAALVVAGIGGAVQQSRTAPYAVPDPSAPTASGPGVLAATSLLLGKDQEVGICLGAIAESRPPQCRSIPVTGITWEDVPWAETVEELEGDETSRTTWGGATIVGTFDGASFAASDVFHPDDPAAPQPQIMHEDEDLPTLCAIPTRGTGSTSPDALVAMAAQLPGYQGLWVEDDQATFNVAVREDVAGASDAVSKVFGGEFCVGTVEGPTEQALSNAQEALEPLTLGTPSLPRKVPRADLNGGASILSTSFGVTARGNRLDVYVVQESAELLRRIHATIGPAIQKFADVSPFFYPIEVSATPDSTSSATSPGPSSITTAPELTDEQRGWAEASVAEVLRSVGQADQPDVTARIAKVTYGQYMAVWNIDIPEPPGPTPDDAEVLVVALSAALDGSATRAEAPPMITAPASTASQGPQEPIGTVTVLDPVTGETLSHATILGGKPPTDRLMDLPGPIEDIALPAGFR